MGEQCCQRGWRREMKPLVEDSLDRASSGPWMFGPENKDSIGIRNSVVAEITQCI